MIAIKIKQGSGLYFSEQNVKYYKLLKFLYTLYNQ